EVGLCEIGLHPATPGADDGEERRLRLDLLARLQLEVDDRSGARCLDLGIGEVERGAIARGDLLAHERVAIGRQIGVTTERGLNTPDSLAQHADAVARLQSIAVGQFNLRRGTYTARRKLMLSLG